MATATQESAKTSNVVTLTGVTTKDNLPPYSDLSRMRILYLYLRAASERFLSNTIFSIASLFQTLEGKSRIYEKTYPRHSHLKHRFIPPPEASDILPPLFLDIHGGGFMIGNPWNDDEPNLCLSTALNCFVVSMNYSKAPSVQFPTPTNELVDTVLDILADTSLRFDRSRVVIGGYSAGGNLCLSVAASPLLKNKLQGVVSWYPVTDWTIHPDEKARSRPYTAASPVDPLRKYHDIIVQAYVDHGSLLDPRLSVTFTPRESLPKHLLIVGAEYDLICKEAAVMAGKYANVDVESLWDKDGGDKFGFEADGIKWVCLRGAVHGFTHTITNFGAEGRKRTQVAKEHYVEVCRWLSDGPFLPKNV